MMIVLDPGHGGAADPGAVGPTGLREADVSYAVAEMLEQRLRAAGLSTLMTRWPHTNPGLSQRAQQANKISADLFVSIHCNAAPNREAQGIEAWHHGASVPGKRLATCLHDALCEEFPDAVRRGVKSDRTRYKSGFAVLRETAMPAALVELEFISHPDREREMATDEWRERCARALFAGIQGYLMGGGEAA